MWGKPSNLKPVGFVPGAAPLAPAKKKEGEAVSVPPANSSKWGTPSGPLSINLTTAAPARSENLKASSQAKTISTDSEPKPVLRAAAGQVWEDPTLATWNPNDFRVFVGNLGPDVTDVILKTAFSAYPSLTNHRVVRDQKSGRSKGYGFLSFSDAAEYTRAMKEMNGKYVGSKPVKMMRSSWKDRNVDEKQAGRVGKQHGSNGSSGKHGSKNKYTPY